MFGPLDCSRTHRGECSHHGHRHVGRKRLQCRKNTSVCSSVTKSRQGVLDNGVIHSTIEATYATLFKIQAQFIQLNKESLLFEIVAFDMDCA